MLLKQYYLLFIILSLIDIIYSCSYQSKIRILEDKIVSKEVPIFEFRKVVEEVINEEDNSKDVYELEVLYNRYIDCLRDHYAQLFMNEIKDKGRNIDEIDITNKKLIVIKECKAAMASAIPQNNDIIKWNYDGTLLELINDIDQAKDEYFVRLNLKKYILIINSNYVYS
jgi:hypothetical protein